VLMNVTLLVLSVLASAATVVILGFLINLYIQGSSSANDPAGLGGLAVFLALVGYYLVGIPALLICTLLWLAYRASRAARARADARPNDPRARRPRFSYDLPSPPL